MKLQTKYILFVSIVHLVALVLSYFIFTEHKLFFILSEIVILFSIFLSWQLYHQLIGPLKLLLQGTEAIRDKDFNVKFRPTGSYEMDELISVYNRMIDELRMERTQQEQQHLFLEKLINTSPTGIMILDYDGHIQQVNPSALSLLHTTEKDLIDGKIEEIKHPVIKHISDLQQGKAMTVTFNNAVTYKLQKSHFIDRGFPRQFIMIEELTAEILAAEKNAYGKVIRMMAHEVNNTIGPVNSIIESALKVNMLPQDESGKVIQEALQVAVNRNYNLNGFMRNFADVVRLPKPSKTWINLHDLVRNTSLLTERTSVAKDIRFIYLLAGTDFMIYADQQQIEQVLINIIKNAMEAIEDNGTISFYSNPLEKKLIITDTGKGIDAAASQQLFSPFFSTKKNGQGIGLTIIREVLHHHGYELSLTTVEPGRTEFIIVF